jgi:glycosyltransferase involved in cell wall biosynthesis
VTASATSNRRRVLVSAASLSPARGSEPGTGWNICSRLAGTFHLTVLSRPQIGDENLRQEVYEYLAKHGPIPGLTIVFVEPPAISRWLQRPHVSLAAPLYYIGYAAWQRAAFRVAMTLHREWPFDLAHHLTITGFREPGYLWKMGIPFIWGPVAGAADVPWRYFRILGPRDRLFYGLKNVVNALHKRTKRRSRKAAEIASHIFANGEINAALIAERWGRASQIMLDTGAPAPSGRPRFYDGSESLRIVWSGLHAGRKALPLLLHALVAVGNSFAAQPYTLTILGSGSETRTWQELAHRLGLGASITWTGQLSHEDAMAEMAKAHVFVLTSVQEGTPTVVMEALASGLPVICHDACGMALAVTDTCGIKIPMRDPRESVRQFAAAILLLIRNPERLHQLSLGAQQRALDLSWDRKVEEIAAAYTAVLQNATARGP